MKNKSILIGTTIGVAIGTAIGVAAGIAIGMATLGLMGIDMNAQFPFWISMAMAVGAGISLVKYVLNRTKSDE